MSFALGAPVFAGFIVLFVASIVVREFAVFAPHYNIWMVPFAALTLTCSLASDSERASLSLRRWAPLLAGAFAVSTTLAGSITMAMHATLYSNGPGNWMGALIPDWSDTLVIHSSDGPWGSLYFALFYQSDGILEQWLIHDDGSIQRIGPSGFEPVLHPAASSGPYAMVLRADSFNLDSRVLASLVRGERDCPDVARGLVGESDDAFCAFLGVGVKRLTGGL